jgi:hypothetical protein
MHHAYIYEGVRSLLPQLSTDARTRFRFLDEHDPDVSVRQWEKFGIDDAIALRQSATLKNLSGRGLFVIGISSITTEAQQSLLKLFEEPQQGIIFVLLLPHGTVLPTLRSRMLVYPGKIKTDAVSTTRAKKFLGASTKTRSLQIGELLKDEEDQRERVRGFLQELEQEVHGAFLKNPEQAQLRAALEDIAKVRSYLSDRSPALKMLLEHLVLTLTRLDLNARLSRVEP